MVEHVVPFVDNLMAIFLLTLKDLCPFFSFGVEELNEQVVLGRRNMEFYTVIMGIDILSSLDLKNSIFWEIERRTNLLLNR